ncbi:RNA polymerase II second largest subunit [Tanacetum coccineum]
MGGRMSESLNMSKRDQSKWVLYSMGRVNLKYLLSNNFTMMVEPHNGININGKLLRIEMVVPDVDSKPPEELRVYGIFKGKVDKRTSFLWLTFIAKVNRDEEKKMGTLVKEDFCCSNRNTTTIIRHGCYDKLDDDGFAPPMLSNGDVIIGKTSPISDHSMSLRHSECGVVDQICSDSGNRHLRSNDEKLHAPTLQEASSPSHQKHINKLSARDHLALEVASVSDLKSKARPDQKKVIVKAEITDSKNEAAHWLDGAGGAYNESGAKKAYPTLKLSLVSNLISLFSVMVHGMCYSAWYGSTLGLKRLDLTPLQMLIDF